MAAITAEMLGGREFRRDHGLRYAYVAGAMYKGITSQDIVVEMGRAGMIGYLGTGGMRLREIEGAIEDIQKRLEPGQAYGMNLLCSLDRPEREESIVDLFLARGVRNIEAAAYVRITPGLVRWRLTGLRRAPDGSVLRPRRTLAKVSRPEVAASFLAAAPPSIVSDLLASGKITAEEAELGARIPLADDICVESDSGGHTDQGVAFALLPAIIAQRDAAMSRFQYSQHISVGAAGGIGTPHAAAAAFVMGAEFILTGSINQCTVEAGTSDAVKDLLQELQVQDTTYAPAGDMFEIGALVQVVRRGLFFPARARRLYELYRRHGSLEEIDPDTRRQIEDRYFKRSFAEVWDETSQYLEASQPGKLAQIEADPRQKMVQVFKWYFVHSTRLAMRGSEDQKVDYQIQCGPAMGAFNQWVKGSELESWRNRRVALIATRLLHATARFLNNRFADLFSASI